MTRRFGPTTALVAGGLLAGLLAGCQPSGPAPGSGPTGPTPAPTAQFTLDWAKPVTDRGNISTSSPVVVDNGGSPFVVTGDLSARLRAFRLHDGADIAGWSNVQAGYEIKAPLSSDGSNVYVPVAQDGKDRVPQFKKYRSNGSLAWNTNPSTVYPQPGKGFLLAGMSLARVDGSWRAYGASSGHWVYGFDGGTGAQSWAFRNADSTMATPALADLYGLGRPQIITSNDKSAETSADRNGGHLRIFTPSGRQICSADQTVTGNTYASSGYNNSSPVVTQVGGAPLIVFGSTGPVQSGTGGNQVVAYDANCGRRWSSPVLAGQAKASPTLADVMGTGQPQVIQLVEQLDGSKKYPRVYVIDPANGAILSDTGATLRGYGGSNLAYTSATSVVTADLNGDGREELFVPASRVLVLDGRTRRVMQEIDMGGSVIQNSPVVTAEPDGGVRVTVAGYSGNNGHGVYGGTIRSYTASRGALGPRGWPRFGHDSQLTGRSGGFDGPYDTLLEGQQLAPGQSLRTRTSTYTATMQTDGNFVVYDAARRPVWSSRTRIAGSHMEVTATGDVRVVAPDGSQQWHSGTTGPGVERLVLGTDGVLRTFSATYTGSERTNVDITIWRSQGTAPSGSDHLTRGATLRRGATLTSENGRYRLAMQSDGNLVLYRGSQALYQSGTRDSSGAAKLAFQTDGNLVIYRSDGRVLKDYGINGRGGVLLTVRDDGVLRVSTAGDATVFATDTRGR